MDCHKHTFNSPIILGGIKKKYYEHYLEWKVCYYYSSYMYFKRRIIS